MMRRNIILAGIFLLIILASVAAGIAGHNEKNIPAKNIDIYFLNEEGSAILAENRDIKYNEKEELLSLTVESLLKGPEEKKHKSVAGKGTKLLDTNLDQSNLTVNFSKEFLKGDSTKDMLSVYAVVRTLCQLDKIGAVMVTVEGKPVTASDGSTIGFIKNTDINLETDVYTTDSKNVVLYFADKEGNSLVKEVRTIKITDTRPIENYVISELIKGPVNKDLSATLTADTELITAETANGTSHVTFKNFIDKNLSDPASQKSMLAVYSVVNSLTELEEIQSVRFLFEGKTAEMVGGFNFAEVFVRNAAIIKQ